MDTLLGGKGIEEQGKTRTNEKTNTKASNVFISECRRCVGVFDERTRRCYVAIMTVKKEFVFRWVGGVYKLI